SRVITSYSGGSNLTISSLSTSLYQPAVNTMGANELYRITPSRELVVTEGEGDLAGFAFQYQNPCSGAMGKTDSLHLVFIYTKDMLVQDNLTSFSGLNGIHQTTSPESVNFHWMGFNGESYHSGVINGNNVELKFTIPIGNLSPGEQHTFFLFFQVDDNVLVNSSYSINGSYNLVGSAPEMCSNATTPSAIGGTIANSHDPNQQLTDPNILVCPGPGATAPLVPYTVHFQNDGNADTKEIRVKVWLDGQLDATGVTHIGQSSNVTLNSLTSNGNNNYVEYTLKPAMLKGTGDPDYLSTFYDDATKGHVEFQVPVRSTATLDGCSGFLSQSEIFFDCNAPIITNVARTPIGCPDTTGNANCEKCLAPDQFTLPTANFAANQDLVSAGAINSVLGAHGMSASTSTFKWFPLEGIINANQQVARFGGTEVLGIKAYYLVVGEPGSCKRLILKVPVHWKNCDLKVDIAPVCQNGIPVNLLIQVQNGTPPYYGMECAGANCCLEITPMSTATSANLTIPIPAQGSLQYIVRDSDGCYAETTINLPFQPLVVEDNPNDCLAKLVITGGAPPYTAQWANTALGPDPNQVVDLRQSVNFGPVIVTDSRGCTYTLNLQKGGCS
ncbi:MAG: hypothetical protein KDC44_02895, partial [Phaeodactylibacter sp.]|nr:hypothetical protein [Phaeodactylibacter sp.]